MSFYLELFASIGMSLILIAFALNYFKKIKRNSIEYDLLNLIGASILAFYAFTLQGWTFLVLNLIWFLIALIHLIIHLKIRFFK